MDISQSSIYGLVKKECKRNPFHLDEKTKATRSYKIHCGFYFEKQLIRVLTRILNNCKVGDKYRVGDYMFDKFLIFHENDVAFREIIKTNYLPITKREALKIDIGLCFFIGSIITDFYAFQCKYMQNSLKTSHVCPFSNTIRLIKDKTNMHVHGYIISCKGITEDAQFHSHEYITQITLSYGKQTDIIRDISDICYQILGKFTRIQEVTENIPFITRLNSLMKEFLMANHKLLTRDERRIIENDLPNHDYTRIMNIVYNILPVKGSHEKCSSLNLLGDFNTLILERPLIANANSSLTKFILMLNWIEEYILEYFTIDFDDGEKIYANIPFYSINDCITT